MCRGRFCDVLGDHPDNWSRCAPLLPPNWFDQQIDTFRAVVLAASNGYIELATSLLARVRSDDLRDWFVEHGQNSGRSRAHILKKAPPSKSTVTLDPVSSPNTFSDQVFARDGYRCRYCQLRVVPKRVFSDLQMVLGRALFTANAKTNKQRHGAVMAFRANIDHVEPWSFGGWTSLENLVTTCWCCNYGKSSYTLEQLGIDDPRLSEPKLDQWDGLIPTLPGLTEQATLVRGTGDSN